MLCVIEAMKLMNEIAADEDGESGRTYLRRRTGSAVEYGQIAVQAPVKSRSAANALERI